MSKHNISTAMFETIKGWVAYIVSLIIGSVGFIEKCNQLLNLVFLTLGIVGLIFSIRLSMARLRKLEK